MESNNSLNRFLWSEEVDLAGLENDYFRGQSSQKFNMSLWVSSDESILCLLAVNRLRQTSCLTVGNITGQDLVSDLRSLIKCLDFTDMPFGFFIFRLTLEQKELCRSRLKLLCYLDRLATYEVITRSLPLNRTVRLYC